LQLTVAGGPVKAPQQHPFNINNRAMCLSVSTKRSTVSLKIKKTVSAAEQLTKMHLMGNS